MPHNPVGHVPHEHHGQLERNKYSTRYLVVPSRCVEREANFLSVRHLPRIKKIAYPITC
jgi:hypothetical protein